MVGSPPLVPWRAILCDQKAVEEKIYGTVAKIGVKPGGLDKLRNWTPTEGAQDSGAVAIYDFQMDDDPNEVYKIALFESKGGLRGQRREPATGRALPADARVA